MSLPNFSPKFIKAKIKFQLDDRTYDVGEQLINTDGVPAFKWEQFEPMDKIGKKCFVFGDIVAENLKYQFSCDALMTCEETAIRRDLGLNFLMEPQDAKNLSEIVAKNGILPDYIRKFPRIVFLEQVGNMPARAILRQKLSDQTVDVVADVTDLSPTGFQVANEDVRCSLVIPSEKWDIIFQPRGDFATPITLSAEVKRIRHAMNPISGNMRRYFSMQIVAIGNQDKLLFAELLRKVVTRFKN